MAGVEIGALQRRLRELEKRKDPDAKKRGIVITEGARKLTFLKSEGLADRPFPVIFIPVTKSSRLEEPKPESTELLALFERTRDIGGRGFFRALAIASKAYMANPSESQIRAMDRHIQISRRSSLGSTSVPLKSPAERYRLFYRYLSLFNLLESMAKQRGIHYVNPLK